MRLDPGFRALLSAALFLGSTNSCFLHRDADGGLDYAAIAAQNNQARSERRNSQHAPKKIAIDNVRVFDGCKVRSPSTVVIDVAVIGMDCKNAEHIDGKGGILIPGLIDSHCHPSNITHLESLGKFGVTTGLVMACFTPELCLSLKNHSGLPDILRSSAPASAVGSVHGKLAAMLDPTLLISNKTQVPNWMNRQLSSNPDYIKLITEDPGLDQETLDLLVQTSHQGGKHVVCHSADFNSYKQAITARVDHIHHAPLDKALTPDMARTILHQSQIVTPTLTMMRAIAENEPQTRNFKAALQSVTTLHKTGVRILAGTDANLQPGIPAAVPFGSSMHDEIENLVSAGLSNLEALQAATVLPARYFGLSDRGVIAPGMRADFFLVGGDPLVDIRATRDVKRVWIAGVEYGV